MEDIRDSSSGKTYPERDQATKGKTSEQSCNRSAKLKTPKFMFLDLSGMAGDPQESSWEMLSALPGVPLMPNFGECRSVEKESTLSAILEENVPDRYSLSQKACQGILNRASKRGKILPEPLMEALLEVAGQQTQEQ